MIVLLLALFAVAVALWLPPGVLHLPARDAGDLAATPDRVEQIARRVPIASNAPPERVLETAAPPLRVASTQPVAGPSDRADMRAVQASSPAALGRQPDADLRIEDAYSPDARSAADAAHVGAPEATPRATLAGESERDSAASPPSVIKIAMRADSSGAATASTTSIDPAHAAAGVPVIAKLPVDAARGSALAGIKLPAGTLNTAGEYAPATHSSNVVRKDDRSTDAQRAQRRHASARELIARGDNDAARVQLREALALDPRLHEARDVLVALLRRSGEPAEARELLAQGLELAPGRAGFATPYARLLVDAGELERASQVLADARASGAGDAQYHALAGAIAQQLGRHDAAVAQYTRAIEVRPEQQGRLWLGLGISLAANGRDVDARHAFRAALDSGDLPERLHAWARGRLE